VNPNSKSDAISKYTSSLEKSEIADVSNGVVYLRLREDRPEDIEIRKIINKVTVAFCHDQIWQILAMPNTEENIRVKALIESSLMIIT
jgi:hypothetical protein